MEFQLQELGCLTTQQHSFHKDLEILTYLSVSGIYVQFKLYGCVILIDLKLR